jgi:nucleotide-binding universal stress UspA family protein
VTRGKGAPVLVGVGDGDSADDAVEWAAAEAAAAGCPLQLLHAFHPPLPAHPYGVPPPVEDLYAAGELVLWTAAARAFSVAGDIEISTRLVSGAAAQALVAAGHRARMIVIGVGRRSGLGGLLKGSTAAHVTARAPCPVVGVRPARDRKAAASAPRVVVGVDGTPTCTAAVTFAFRAARQRGIPLTAVHAWTPDVPADLELACGRPTVAEAEGCRVLERALHRPREEFPDVPVATQLVCAEPVRALVTEADGAALVVVGSRGRGRILGTVLGSVSRPVLERAGCPVAVVRPDATTTAGTADPAAGEHEHVPHRGLWRQGFRIRRTPR